jgi:hypothetical protein
MIRGLLLVAVGLASIVWTMPARAALNPAAPDFPGDRVIELCADPGRERDSVGSGDDALFKACSTARTKRLDIEGGWNVAVIGGAYATAAAGTVPPGQPPIPPALAAPPAPATYYHPASYVPPNPPAPAASVLTDLSNHPLLAATPALDLDVLNGIVESFQNQAKLWEKNSVGPGDRPVRHAGAYRTSTTAGTFRSNPIFPYNIRDLAEPPWLRPFPKLLDIVALLERSRL